jgi:hypothetical protein
VGSDEARVELGEAIGIGWVNAGVGEFEGGRPGGEIATTAED